MSLVPLLNDSTAVEWKGWKMPQGIEVPPKPEGYGDAAKTALQQLLAEKNLPFQMPTLRPDTKLAHIGTWVAAQQGKQFEFVKQVFHQFWSLGADLSDEKVLGDAAELAGLARDSFIQALGEPEALAAVTADYEFIQEHQITTIPAYIGEKGRILVHHFKDMPTLSEIRNLL